MVKLIIVKKNGTVNSSNSKLTSIDDICKKCGFSTNKNFCKRHTWEMKENYYSLYAKDSGSAGSENKYDLPPPVDTQLYFGNMVLLKHTDKEISLETLVDCDKEDFNVLYSFLFGGFDDLESEEESEDEYIDPVNLTKDGYDKTDGFVVDSDDISDISCDIGDSNYISDSNGIEFDDIDSNETEEDSEIEEEYDDGSLSEESFVSEEDESDGENEDCK